MLKQNYILIDDIPQHELTIINENLKTSVNWRLAVLPEASLEEKISRLAQYQADNCILISADPELLSRMSRSALTTIGYVKNGETIFGIDMLVEGFWEVDERFLERVYQRKHELPWTILETGRCMVREITLTDLDALFELYSGPGMTDYMEPLYDYEREKEYQRAYIEHMYGYYGYGMWLIIQKESGKVIGRAGLECREEFNGEIELGYAISASCQRQGYATEVCRGILRYAHEELECERINCFIEEGNTVSEHLAEKLGFAFGETLIINQKKMKRYVYTY